MCVYMGDTNGAFLSRLSPCSKQAVQIAIVCVLPLDTISVDISVHLDQGVCNPILRWYGEQVGPTG